MRRLALAALLVLGGCSRPLGPAGFSASGAVFDPLAFFTGHVTSWGVEENRGGAPIAIVTTDCQGVASGPGAIRMVQVLRIGAARPQTRIWQMRRIDAGHYVATANDMAGHADGVVAGRVLHWRWVLRADPGDALADVTMEQWLYQMDDGAVVIRTVITKLGVRLLQVTEQFEKQPA